MSAVKDSVWQLQEAKAKFSRVVNRALADGPQLITRGGKPAVYIVSVKRFDRDRRSSGRKEILLSSPYKEVEIEFVRDESCGREVAL